MNEEALQKYSDSVAEKSRRNQTARARAYLQWLGSKEPSKKNVIKYRDKLAERYADGSIKQDMQIIRKLHQINGWPWEFNRGELITVREMEVEQPAIGMDWLEDMVDVVLGIKASASHIIPQNKHVALLCASTIWGLRRIELQEINPSCLDIENKTMFIQTAKGGRQRYHLIPEFAIPYLNSWGFKEKLSFSLLDQIFTDLKMMVGFTGPISRGVGWHAIRRSAISLAWDAGFNEPQVHSYYRWKMEGRSMALRYAGGKMITKQTKEIRLAAGDLELDTKFHECHPMILIWKDKLAQLGGLK